MTQVEAQTSSWGPRGVASSSRVTGISHRTDWSRMVPEPATNRFSRAWTCACVDYRCSEHMLSCDIKEDPTVLVTKQRRGRTAYSVHWNELFQRLLRLRAGSTAFMTPGRTAASAAARMWARDRLHSACFARSCATGRSLLKRCVRRMSADQQDKAPDRHYNAEWDDMEG